QSTPTSPSAPASLDDLDFMGDGPISERFGNRRDRAATQRTRCEVRERPTPRCGIECAIGQRCHGVFIQAVRLRDGSFARMEITAQAMETDWVAHISPHMRRPAMAKLLISSPANPRARGESAYRRARDRRGCKPPSHLANRLP